MKIAIWHNLPSGGGKRALYDHVVGLIARGHTVEAWCPPTADGEYLPLKAVIPEHVIGLDWPKNDRVSDKLGITRKVERQIRAMDRHCEACAEEIDKGNFDILYANCCSFFRATAIGRFSRTPSIIYLQEPYRWLYEAMPRLKWLARPRSDASIFSISALKAQIQDYREIRNARLQAREEVDNAACFNRILVNSYFSRESVLRAYGLESDVCYLGINTELFADKGMVRENIVIGLGSFTREKNVRLCIEALAALPQPRPKLMWLGNISSPAYMTEMRELAVAKNVDFEPKVGVTDVELIDILNRSKVMLYAPWLEPFGLAPLEANACGLPVIAVAEGGVRETIVDGINGLLVDSNPASMAFAIQRLLDSPALAYDLGKRARLNVECRWSMTAAIDRLEDKLIAYARPQHNTIS